MGTPGRVRERECAARKEGSEKGKGTRLCTTSMADKEYDSLKSRKPQRTATGLQRQMNEDVKPKGTGKIDSSGKGSGFLKCAAGLTVQMRHTCCVLSHAGHPTPPVRALRRILLIIFLWYMAALLDNAMNLQLINRIEQVTGADIDGDGDIGEGESGDLPFVNSAETLTGFDLDGDGDIGSDAR